MQNGYKSVAVSQYAYNLLNRLASDEFRSISKQIEYMAHRMSQIRYEDVDENPPLVEEETVAAPTLTEIIDHAVNDLSVEEDTRSDASRSGTRLHHFLSEVVASNVPPIFTTAQLAEILGIPNKWAGSNLFHWSRHHITRRVDNPESNLENNWKVTDFGKFLALVYGTEEPLKITAPMIEEYREKFLSA